MVRLPDEPSIFRSSATVVRGNVDRALGMDARAALIAARRLADDDVPWLEERAVRLARAEGLGWAKIGRLLHRSRQAVWRQYRERLRTPMPPPLRPGTRDERFMSLVHRSYAAARREREFEASDARHVVPW